MPFRFLCGGRSRHRQPRHGSKFLSLQLLRRCCQGQRHCCLFLVRCQGPCCRHLRRLLCSRRLHFCPRGRRLRICGLLISQRLLLHRHPDYRCFRRYSPLVDQGSSTSCYQSFISWSCDSASGITDEDWGLTMQVGPVVSFAIHYCCP